MATRLVVSGNPPHDRHGRRPPGFLPHRSQHPSGVAWPCAAQWRTPPGCHSGRDLRHRQPNPGWVVRQAQATWPGSSPNCLATIPRSDSLPWPQTGAVCNLLNHNPQCGGPTPKHGCLGGRMDGPGSFQVGSARPTGGQERPLRGLDLVQSHPARPSGRQVQGVGIPNRIHARGARGTPIAPSRQMVGTDSVPLT